DGLHAVHQPLRDLHEEAFGRNERLLPLDREANLPILHNPERAIVLVESPRRLRAWRHRDVLAVEKIVVNDELRPALLTLMVREHLRKPGPRPVRWDEAIRFHWQRRPDVDLRRRLPLHGDRRNRHHQHQTGASSDCDRSTARHRRVSFERPPYGTGARSSASGEQAGMSVARLGVPGAWDDREPLFRLSWHVYRRRIARTVHPRSPDPSR